MLTINQFTGNFEPHYLTLPNGLRLVHVSHNSPVAWCGVAVNAGSRDEEPGGWGLAHFVEHTIFKGTRRRSSGRIVNRMETVGGELNAYTTKESTMLYSVFPEPYVERAMELIADLVMNSTFPARELDHEREVVLEEVASYRDSPAEAVIDDFEDMMMTGSELGHNILGVEDDIRRMTGSDCMRFLKELYVPGNMVFFSVGSTSPGKVFRLAERYFSPMHHKLQPSRRVTPAVLPPERRMVELGLHQAHTIVGFRVGDMYSEDRFAMALLNNILGGPGMNALLNVNLREKRGLVYTVESNLVSFTDCGMLQIYLGCEREKLKKALQLIENTINRLAQSPLQASRLESYKRQYCGQLLVASASAEVMAMNAGRGLLYYNHVGSLEDNIKRIMALTPEQLQEQAQAITPDRCSILTLQ